MFKGALFDLDGVIADTAPLHFNAWKQIIFKHFGLNLPDSIEEKTKGVSREDSLRVILKYLNISISDYDFMKLCEEKNLLYVESLEKLTPKNILPGLETFIQDLQRNGIKLALASSSKNGPYILKKLELDKSFQAIVNPENITEGKPAPDIFLEAAKSIQCKPEECIAIEDSVAGVTAINSANIFSIAVGGAELNHANTIFNSTKDLTLSEVENAWQIQKKIASISN
ncbi:TPA: beta-phosphoglucomutase [Streptococcus suis]|nr:beta-phosphoglucomutase [Streptococcus suis]HEM5295128.1 beta-phosphoglucomutase [Streptococcus suis]HEM5308394.1 beta-phosphoglucomutase [Streptococcus suis]